MTLPTSGAISHSAINTELGLASNYSSSLSFLNNLITAGQSAGAGTGGTGVAVASQRPSSPNMGAFYNKAYYQSSKNGNCDNGNCSAPQLGNCPVNCPADCGNCARFSAANCSLAVVNCANCDSQKWLQTNCNCACTYNCSQVADQYTACNCNCHCDCAFSDDRLKNRSGAIENALGIVKKLTGFYYTGNDLAQQHGLDSSLQAGVSAQDVEAEFPVALGAKLSGEYLTVDYSRLVPLLLEAVKELEAQVATLKEKQ